MQSTMRTLITMYGLLLFGGQMIYTPRPTAPVENLLAANEGKLKVIAEEEQWQVQKENPQAERAMDGDEQNYPIDEAFDVVGKDLHRWWKVLQKVPMPNQQALEGFLILVGGARLISIVIQMLIWTKNHLTKQTRKVPKTESLSRTNCLCKCSVHNKRTSDPDLHISKHSSKRRLYRMRRKSKS